LARPDPYGSAEVESVAGVVAHPLVMIKDTFTPQWNVRWDRVPLTASTRLRVSLMDKDLANEDPIGEVVLNAQDLLGAMATGTNDQIRVDGQTNGQLLFVGVEVVPENGALPVPVAR
jgi:hypothetical protein